MWNPLKSVESAFSSFGNSLEDLGHNVLSAPGYYAGELGKAADYYGPQIQGGIGYYTPYAAPAVGIAGTFLGGPLVGAGLGAATGAAGSLLSGEDDPGTWFRNVGLGAAPGLVAGAANMAWPYLAGEQVAGALPEVSGAYGVESLGGVGNAFTGAGSLGSGAAPILSSLAPGGATMAGLDYGTLALLGGKGILDYSQRQAQMDAMKAYTNANKRAMKRMEAYASNPNLMYEQDPGLAQLRKNAMDQVTARQLALTGGAEGGNYARQLIAESAAIDRANLERMFGLNQQLMAQTSPYFNRQLDLGGNQWGAGAGVAQNMLNDFAFLSLIGAV